jgi:hypothetical protein
MRQKIFFFIVEFGGELGELNKATAAAAAVKTTE